MIIYTLLFLIPIYCRHNLKQVSSLSMKDIFRILALTLLALSVSVIPLRGFANMDTMDCCEHMDGTQAQTDEALSAADQNNDSGCPHQDDCQSGNCLTASPSSTPGLTASNLLSFKPVTANLYGRVDYFYSSQSTPPLLKPPCILPI